MTDNTLNRATFPKSHQIGASAPENPGIVHLGIGNFHRAHASVYTAKAMAAQGGNWGIVGVANRSHRVVDALTAQDHLYSILEMSPAGVSADIVDVHRKCLVAAEQPMAVMDEIANPDRKIVTMTISENGYLANAQTGHLDVDSDVLKADLANPEVATTMVGLLSRGLLRRWQQGGAPITVLSCDNMQSAGTTSHRTVTEYLQALKAPAEVFDWLASSVTFPNAMVDRIVPGTTDATRAKVQELLGLEDKVPVPAEKFTMWVIEDKFAAGRPAWETAGAIFSDEVEKYELVKLRLLNGSHSLIAYLGGLLGSATIPEARSHDFVAQCVDAAIRNEYLPSIDLPEGFDSDAYIAELFDRWLNFALGDATSRVGSDGSLKLLQRVPVPALRMLDMGEMPQQLALTVAAWICCVAPPAGFDPGEVAAAMIEPARDRLAKAVAGATDISSHVTAIMQGGFFPDDLAAHDEFTARVADLTEIIVRSGVQAAAEDALASAVTA